MGITRRKMLTGSVNVVIAKDSGDLNIDADA